MQRFCLLVLALSVVSAVEAKAATKKRGLASLLGYGYTNSANTGWSNYGLNNYGLNYNYGNTNYFPSQYTEQIPVLASLGHGGPLIPHDYNFGPELALPPPQRGTINYTPQLWAGDIPKQSNFNAGFGAELSAPPFHQEVFSFAPQLLTGGIPKQNGYNTGFGLGAYGSTSANFGGQKYTSTSSSENQVPLVTVPVSGYKPAYPPFMQIPASSARTSFPTAIVSKPDQLRPTQVQQPAVTLGSGGLGVVRLSNGNFALGSGSIGYGGSAPIIGNQQNNKQQIQPVFSAQPPTDNRFGGAYL